MKWIENNPVIVGTTVKAMLALATIVGLQTTEADREVVVVAVLAVAAAVGVLTKKERDAVTPMKKLEDTATDIGGNALKLVAKLKGLVD